MVYYQCEKCKKEFYQKSNYLTHLNRKNPCVKNAEVTSYNTLENPKEPTLNHIEPKVDPKEPYVNDLKDIKYKCHRCPRSYTTNSHMNRHMKGCKEASKNKEIEELKQLLISQSKDIEILKSKKNNKVSINNANNTNNTNN